MPVTYLILRGLKTLPVRMDRHCQNATHIAEFLSRREEVAAIHYPGLANHPQHALALRQMSLPGTMIGLELHGGIEAGRRFINALRLATLAVSLGDAETLVQHPASMTHAAYTAEERKRHLIDDGLVRLSIGLEDVADLQCDLEQALRAAACN